MRENDRRDKLIGLGSERLADALLEMADRTDDAEALVVRMTSTQDEIIKRFRGKLAGLKRSRKFVDWRGAQFLAEKLGRKVDLVTKRALRPEIRDQVIREVAMA